MKRKAVIYGANNAAKYFVLRANYVFDIYAFVDRSVYSKGQRDFLGIPIHPDLTEIKKADIDYIFVMLDDYDTVLRRLQGQGIKTKVMSMLYGHQLNKQKQFCALANEIYRSNIPGSVAELGVDFGGTAQYLNLFFEDRKLYLFDTFEGFNIKDIEKEIENKTIDEKYVHYYDNRSNEMDIVERMFYPESVVIKKGYFPDSLDGLEDTFAFVHIDCDLSKPILAALEYFYPRLSIGGFICIHDYFNFRFTGVQTVVRDFAEKYNAKFVPVVEYYGAIISK